MTKNYRQLKLSKEDMKNLFNLKAIDFATDKEKKRYTYFNISSIYKISLVNKDVCCFCGVHIAEKGNCKHCRNGFPVLDKEIFSKDYFLLGNVEEFLKKQVFKLNVEIVQKVVLRFNNKS